MHIFVHCIVFGVCLARNIENENNLGRRREKGISPDQLPLFLDMARLCNSVFYPNESQTLDNRCTLLVMHYFRKEDLYDKKFNKNKNRRKRRSASWNQYSRNYEFPNPDSGQKCQRKIFRVDLKHVIHSISPDISQIDVGNCVGHCLTAYNDGSRYENTKGKYNS